MAPTLLLHPSFLLPRARITLSERGSASVGPIMQFTGDLAQFQQAATRTEDYAARRAATLRALEPRRGEIILEVGCGGGLFLRELAEAVGPTGKACGIDVSEEQLQAAR